jgi:hypothetical protein
LSLLLIIYSFEGGVRGTGGGEGGGGSPPRDALGLSDGDGGGADGADAGADCDAEGADVVRVGVFGGGVLAVWLAASAVCSA